MDQEREIRTWKLEVISLWRRAAPQDREALLAMERSLFPKAGQRGQGKAKEAGEGRLSQREAPLQLDLPLASGEALLPRGDSRPL